MTNSTDSLWKLGASDLISLIQEKEISPEEVLNSNLDRIEEVNSAVNAVVTLCTERARKILKDEPEKINSCRIIYGICIMLGYGREFE